MPIGGRLPDHAGGQTRSRLLGVVLPLAAAAWYLFYARDVQLKDRL